MGVKINSMTHTNKVFRFLNLFSARLAQKFARSDLGTQQTKLFKKIQVCITNVEFNFEVKPLIKFRKLC